MSKSLYKIIFEDNSEFIGGDLQNSKWNEIPDKPIKKLIYEIGSKVIFSSFEAYNHIIEKVKFVNFSGETISKIIVMGKYSNKVYRLIFDLKNKRTLNDISDFGFEYNNKATTGWKKGVKGFIPLISTK